MMQVKVFISGPIQGMEDKQDYRDRLRKILLAYGFEPIDPWLREKVMYSWKGERWWRDVSSKGFIERDLADIEKCDILVAYLPVLSAGTCMELFYAKRLGKKTIVICEIENPSPWIIFHSDITFKTLNEFEKFLKETSGKGLE